MENQDKYRNALEDIRSALISNREHEGDFENPNFTLGWISSFVQTALECERIYR